MFASSPFRLASLGLFLAVAALAAEPSAPPPPPPAPADSGTSDHVKEAIRESLAEDIKFAPPPADAPKTTVAATAAAAGKTDPAPAPVNKPKDNVTEAREDPATMLPKLEVRRNRVTDEDAKLKANEEQAAKEKELTKSSEADKALNNSKVAKALSIFGGQGATERERIAAQRVELLQDEHDLLEQKSLAKTKAEKDELQKEIDALKALRRDLEASQH
ncbi:hypothetical protein K0B96_06235 [Horticoccus luteus]|uniref:Uncharacterized protein n=1 Tax=Horticoccus luteus TaxID=2862869 RepID=A0A8F9TY95_9BACT|nr:hypothetical protein [Horticoccus luteus]QYM80211.1 hypothetical protein K0B96_06235 [Horticoccus luteus]